MMRRAFLFFLSLLALSCGQKNIDHKVLESEDGLVRITAWETPLSGMSGSYTTEMEYWWEGHKHVVRKSDEDAEETVMMPMRLHSLGNNLYLLYELYRESSWQAYLEMGAYKLLEKGLSPVSVFATSDGLSNRLSTEITSTNWDYELSDDSSEYWWIYYFNTEKGIIYHPITQDGAITGQFVQYIWDGEVFSPSEITDKPF